MVVINSTTNSFVDIMYEMINQEIDKTDDTVLCEISEKIDDAHYNVYVVPDRTNVVTGVPNMTRFNFKPGDYCYVYKVNNQFTNSFICFKLIPAGGDGSYQEDLSLSSAEIAALGMKEDKINKITQLNQSVTDEQYPSAKSVVDALNEIKQIIEGRTSSYVVSSDTYSVFQSNADVITLNSNIQDINGDMIYLSQLRVGDAFHVVETSWPDRWVGNANASSAVLYKTKMPEIPVTNITLNGIGIVNNTVGALTTSNGIVSNGGNISLSLSGAPTITPKNMTLSEQSGVKIFLEQNGTIKTASINDLDYTKLKVVESASESTGLASINTEDFLFVKNTN